MNKRSTLLKLGKGLSAEERMPYLLEIRESIEQGYASVTEIANRYGITEVTASSWRRQALQMIAKDDNGYTREGIRNIQVGRIQWMIERLQRQLDTESDTDTRLKIHDRIVKYYDSMARITGLNSEQVNVTTQQLKPLEIVRSNVIDVDGIEQQPSTN